MMSIEVLRDRLKHEEDRLICESILNEKYEQLMSGWQNEFLKRYEKYKNLSYKQMRNVEGYR